MGQTAVIQSFTALPAVPQTDPATYRFLTAVANNMQQLTQPTGAASIPAIVGALTSTSGTTASVGSILPSGSIPSALSSFADTTTPSTPGAPSVTTSFSVDAFGNPYVILQATVTPTGDANVAGYLFSLTIGSQPAIAIPTTKTSFSWQVPPNASYSVKVAEQKLSGVTGAYSAATTGTTSINSTPPNPCTALTATGGIGAIFLTWTNPTNLDLDHIEIWRNSSSTAYGTLIAKVPQSALQATGVYQDVTLTNIAPYYYWVRAVNTSNAISAYNSTTGTSATPATVGAGGIANAALALSNFAAGIQPVQYVTALSSAVTGNGALAFLSTDQTIYRWNGSSWVNSVASSLVTGLIPTTQLSGYIQAAQIQANSIGAGQIAANSITASQIAANTITVSQIAAGTITSAVIATGGITAASLAVQAANLMRDPCFQNVAYNSSGSPTGIWGEVSVQQYSGGTYVTTLGNYPLGTASASGWYLEGQDANTQSMGVPQAITLYASSAYNQSLAQVRYLIGATGTATSAGWAQSGCSPIVGNETYELGATCWNASNQTCCVQVQLYDVLVNYLGAYVVDFAAGSGITTQTIQFTAPATAAYAQPLIYNLANNTFTGYQIVSGLSLRQAAGGTLIVNGSITGSKIAANTITASNILAGTITTTQIAANTITGSNIAAGTITAANIVSGTITGTQIAAGSIAASNINVANLSAISANLGAITGGSLNINGAFVVTSAGAVTISSTQAGSGYTTIANALISVYDGSNTLRVELGVF